jgi:hypothetical protein
MQNNKDNSWGADFDWAKCILFAGIITNLSALFWKAFDFIIYTLTGKSYGIFDVFYLLLHGLSETIISCLIILIAYGWTINYISGSDFDIFLPLSNIIYDIKWQWWAFLTLS